MDKLMLFTTLHNKTLSRKSTDGEDPLALLSQVIPEEKFRDHDLVC